jgi:drug/metabolite transporter (DMT)-like permease
MTADRERVALAAFVTAAVLAGGNAICIRFSNRELAPLWGAGLRFSLAAALLGAAMAVLKLKPPRGRALTGAFLYGLLNFGAAFALAYYALVRLHAGFAQTLLALVPLVTLLLAVVQRQERLHLAAVAGTLLAVAGIAVMSRAPLRESLPLLSVLATLASAVCIAQAAVLVRRFPPVHPVTMNAVAMTTAAVVLVTGSALAASRACFPSAPSPGSRSAWWSWSARSWCSCSTWSCSATGPPRGRPTGSCSPRSSRWCCRPGLTTSRSMSG